MWGSARSMTSPRRPSTRRRTPWAAGCWGPKLSVKDLCSTGGERGCSRAMAAAADVPTPRRRPQAEGEGGHEAEDAGWSSVLPRFRVGNAPVAAGADCEGERRPGAGAGRVGRQGAPVRRPSTGDAAAERARKWEDNHEDGDKIDVEARDERRAARSGGRGAAGAAKSCSPTRSSRAGRHGAALPPWWAVRRTRATRAPLERRGARGRTGRSPSSLGLAGPPPPARSSFEPPPRPAPVPLTPPARPASGPAE